MQKFYNPPPRKTPEAPPQRTSLPAPRTRRSGSSTRATPTTRARQTTTTTSWTPPPPRQHSEGGPIPYPRFRGCRIYHFYTITTPTGGGWSLAQRCTCRGLQLGSGCVQSPVTFVMQSCDRPVHLCGDIMLRDMISTLRQHTTRVRGIRLGLEAA